MSQNLQKNACALVSFNKVNKVAGLQPGTLLKRRLSRVFSCEFSEFLRTPFSTDITGRLLLPVIFCLGSGELLRKTVLSAKCNFSEMEK